MKLGPDLYQAIEREPHVILVLDPQLRIRFINRAWGEHARRDNSPSVVPVDTYLGKPYLDLVRSVPLRFHLAKGLERVAEAGPRPCSAWVHSECNTPQTFRRLTTRFSALWDKGFAGCVVHNSLRAVGPIRDRYAVLELPVDEWRDSSGLINQCGCCRRLRHPITGSWVVSMALIEGSAPGTSHGLCELCLETYYGEVVLTSDETTSKTGEPE